MWVLLFVLITLTAAIALSLIGGAPRETVQQRLDRLVKKRPTQANWVALSLAAEAAEAAKPQGEKVARNALKDALVSLVEKSTSNRRYSRNLEERLLRSDWKWRPAEFMVAQAIAGGVGLLIGLLVARSLSLIFAVAGALIPLVLLSRSEKARLKAFGQQLPDALAMIANALRSGYSFLQAMDVVSREMPTPISQEFGLVLREARVNIPLEESLNHMVERVKSPDLDLVVTAVLIQRQVGGNLSEVLERISGTIRDRIKLKGEIRTLTTQGRISGYVVAGLPIFLALMMQMLSPGYIAPLFHSPVGWLMIGVGVVMETIGMVVIRGMVNMEV